MRKRYKLLIVLLIVFSIIAFFIGKNILTLDLLKHYKDVLKSFIDSNYTLSIFLYVFIYSISSALPIPANALLTVAGGYLYGVLPAVIFADISICLGILYSHTFFKKYIKVSNAQPTNKTIQHIVKNIKTNGALYLFAIRLVPVMPVFSINYASYIIGVKLRTLLLTTALGIIPGAYIYASAGSRISQIKSLGDILTFQTLIILGVIAGIALIPVFVRRVYKFK